MSSNHLECLVAAAGQATKPARLPRWSQVWPRQDGASPVAGIKAFVAFELVLRAVSQTRFLLFAGSHSWASQGGHEREAGITPRQ